MEFARASATSKTENSTIANITTNENPQTDNVSNNSEHEAFVIFVQFILPAAGLLFLIMGAVLLRNFCAKHLRMNNRNRNNSPDETTPSNGIYETNFEGESDTELQTLTSVSSQIQMIEQKTESLSAESERQMMELIKKYMRQIAESMKHEEQYKIESEDSTLRQQFQHICQAEFALPRTSFEVFSNNKSRLGTGYFGVVHKGLFKHDDGMCEYVAIKQLTRTDNKYVQSFLSEIKIYQLIGKGHPSIVRFIGACCASGMTDYMFIPVI